MIKYLEKYGTPDAVFFSYKRDEFFAIWGFDDIYSLTKNQFFKKNVIDDLQNKLNDWGYVFDLMKKDLKEIMSNKTNQI